MQQYHLIFHLTKGLTLQAVVTNFLTIRFIMIYDNIFLSARIVNIWNNLPNSVKMKAR